MKTKKLLTILVGAMFLALVIAPMASAAISSIAYSQGTQGGTKTVTKGDQVDVQVASVGISEQLEWQKLEIEGGPNNIDNQFFYTTNPGTYENGVYEYGRTYTIDTNQYSPGTYTVKFTAKGQNSQPETETLTLVIDPQSQPQDTNAPNININHPQTSPTGGYYAAHINEFRAYVTDNEGNLDKCWYSTDGGQTNSTKVNCNSGQNVFSSLTSVEGTNNWTFYASDTAGNVAKDVVTFEVQLNQDTTAPSVNIQFPFPFQPSYPNPISQMNFTASDQNLDQCWYTTDGGQTNTTVSCTDGVQQTISGLNTQAGNLYNWTVYAEDNAGNVGSATVSFSIQSQPQNTAPSINITSPSTAITLNPINKIEYEISDPDGNLDKCWFSNDGGQTTTAVQPCSLTSSPNVFYGVGPTSQGNSYDWTIYVNDTDGEVSQDTVSFQHTTTGTVDVNSPEVNITFPQDGQTFTDSLPSMPAYIATDAQSNLDSCWYTLNGGQPNNLPVCQNGSQTFIPGLNPQTGQNTLTVYANDTAGNPPGSDSVNFTINQTTVPTTNQTQGTGGGSDDVDDDFQPGQSGDDLGDYYDDQYQDQQDNQIRYINVTDTYPQEEELNWFQKFINWLAGLFGSDGPY